MEKEINENKCELIETTETPPMKRATTQMYQKTQNYLDW